MTSHPMNVQTDEEYNRDRVLYTIPEFLTMVGTTSGSNMLMPEGRLGLSIYQAPDDHYWYILCLDTEVIDRMPLREALGLSPDLSSQEVYDLTVFGPKRWGWNQP